MVYYNLLFFTGRLHLVNGFKKEAVMFNLTVYVDYGYILFFKEFLAKRQYFQPSRSRQGLHMKKYANINSVFSISWLFLAVEKA